MQPPWLLLSAWQWQPPDNCSCTSSLSLFLGRWAQPQCMQTSLADILTVSLLFWAQGRQVATLFLCSPETGREVWTLILSFPSCLAHSQSATFRCFNEQLSDVFMRVSPPFLCCGFAFMFVNLSEQLSLSAFLEELYRREDISLWVMMWLQTG